MMQKLKRGFVIIGILIGVAAGAALGWSIYDQVVNEGATIGLYPDDAGTGETTSETVDAGTSDAE